MSEEKKICPFMNRSNPIFDDNNWLYCQEEKCMAWGKLWQNPMVNDAAIYGCKLINKPV
jgi:hypothetical protein